jgi:hypothetical protein
MNRQTLERIKQIATGQSETMTAPKPQTEDGENTPATDEIRLTEEPEPDEPLGETSAEQ